MRGPRLLAAGLALLLLAPALARGQATAVVVRPHWRAGDGQTLEVVKERAQGRPGTAGRRLRSQVRVAVRVLEASPAGHRMEWTFGEAALEGGAEPPDPVASELARLGSGLRYELDVDPEGVVRGLRNWREVRTLAETALGRMLARLREGGAAARVVEAVERAARGLLASEAQLMAHALREVNLYHAPFGRAYTPGTPVELALELPSPFGGGPLPARARFGLRHLEAETGQATLDWTQAVDPVVARRLAFQALTELARRAGAA
ncbi:MAG TPA: hypothetical protein VLI67_08925, partial [Vicinamibacteria bacterium]|nr:hypothetical protein [Vicinamibacteria bacterium]